MLWKWQRITQYDGIPARFSFDTLTNPAKQPKLRACSSTTKLQKKFPRKIRQHISKPYFLGEKHLRQIARCSCIFHGYRLRCFFHSKSVFFLQIHWWIIRIPRETCDPSSHRMGACKPTSNCWWCNPLYPYNLQNKGLKKHVKPWSLNMPYLDPLIISYNYNTSPANGVIRSLHLNYLVYQHKPHSLSSLANSINGISKTFKHW